MARLPDDDVRNGEAARKGTASPRLPQGRATKAERRRQRGDVAVRSAMWGKGCRQYPGLKRTRASANTSGPDLTMARRPLVKLRSSLRRAAPNEENLFLLPDRALASEPAKRTIRPLT